MIASIRSIFLAATIIALGTPAAGDEAAGTALHASIKLRTGGDISGRLLDFNDHGLVLLNNQTPYVFSWRELEGGSAYAVRRAILLDVRGGVFNFDADDHFQLGLFALQQGRTDLASNAFTAAARINPSYKRRGESAFAEFHHRSEPRTSVRADQERQLAPSGPSEPDPSRDRDGVLFDNDQATEPRSDKLETARPPDHEATETSVDWPLVPIDNNDADLREKIRVAYLTYGEKVREVLGRDIALVETDHFLIWTDWRFRERPRLAEWFEAMYVALCDQFDLDPAHDIFLAKCPAFVFQRPGRFRKFAQKFDGYDGKSAVGYTRSVEATGHTHLVLVRQGDSDIDFDAFASTLVHEGTHAFIHRLYSPRLIPHWVNEGFAERMASRVLGDRSPAGGNAALLARQYARHGPGVDPDAGDDPWSIREMIESTDPIPVHQYPLAHSVVAHLEGKGRQRLAGFIRSLKDGMDVSSALAVNYDGLTLDDLESQWRKAHQPKDTPAD